jgi:hypothetical protein
LATVEGYFEPNLGQARPGVDFVGRGAVDIAVSSSDIAILLKGANGKATRVGMRWANGNPKVKFVPRGILPGISGYFRGKDPSKWLSRVPHYTHVEAKDVYPGIDLILYWTADRMLEYDFAVRPGADPRLISLQFDGLEDLVPDASGSLVMKTLAGEIVHRRPRVFQQRTDGERIEIQASYTPSKHLAGKLDPSAPVHFDVAGYDISKELLIDPVIQFSTLIGARVGEEEPGEIAVDSGGGVYVSGISMNIEGSELVPLVNPWQPGGNLT